MSTRTTGCGSTARGPPSTSSTSTGRNAGCFLTSLIEAADRVDSTVGVQMAYLKRWAPRALQPLELREPAQVAGPPGTAVRRDANQLAGELDGIDVAYLDPPYNQHSLLRELPRLGDPAPGDAPDHYGVACKRVDCRTTKFRLQLPSGGRWRAGRSDRPYRVDVDPALVLRRELSRPRGGRPAAGRTGPGRRRRDRLAPLRRRDHRHPQPTGRARRYRFPPAQHRGAVCLRADAEPASTRSSSQVDGTARFRFVPVPGVAGQHI